MALPEQRVNRLTNPAPASTTGFSTTGAGGTWSYNTGEAQPFTRFTKDGTTAATGFYLAAANNITGAIGTITSMRVWVRCSSSLSITLRNQTTSIAGATFALTANVWQELVVENHAITIANFRFGATIASVPANATLDFKLAIVEQAATCPGYFDGGTVETGYTHAWTGTANASTSTRDVYGVWPEQSVEAGAPKVQVTAIGLGVTSVTTQVVRETNGETWTVPGWKKRNTVGGATFTDFAPPLGRPLTYTLYVNGNAVSSRTITVTSTSGWVQSPIQPELAMPINTDGSDINMLGLAKPSLKSVVYSSRGEEEYPLGGAYPIARAATRGAAGGLQLVLNAKTDAVSDTFQSLMADSPILLFRGLPSWGSLPALAYLKGDVTETPFNRDVGNGFTQWIAEGKLVAPVATAPLTGTITNAMVATNLAGRTHSSIAAASGNKRNIDIAANPLGLGS